MKQSTDYSTTLRENKKKIDSLNRTLLISTILLIITSFLLYISYEQEHTIGGHTYSDFIYIFGIFALFPGGWIGIILIFLATNFLKSYKVRKAGMYGMIGCILIGLHMVIMLMITIIRDSFHMLLGFLLGFIIWILLCCVTGILFLYRKEYKNVIICSNCARILPQNSRFCDKCGTPIYFVSE